MKNKYIIGGKAFNRLIIGVLMYKLYLNAGQMFYRI